MWAFALALAILMWLWSSLGRVLVQYLAGRSLLPTRMAWLAVAFAAGMATLLLATWTLLPDSYVSRGWTREMLELVQLRSTVLVLAVGGLEFAKEWLSSGATSGSPASSQSKPARR